MNVPTLLNAGPPERSQRKLNGKMFWSEFWTNQFKYENMDVTVFPHFNYGLTFRPWS